MVTVKNNGLRENEALHATWFHHVRSGCGSLLHLFFSGQVKDPAWMTCLPRLCLWASSVAFGRSVSTDGRSLYVVTAAVHAFVSTDGSGIIVTIAEAPASVHTDAGGMCVVTAAE